MELKEILAISGQPGLYKYVAQSTNGVIVESLLDGRRMNDRDRVHVSDMKKCFAWYNILVRAGFTEFKLPSEAE